MALSVVFVVLDGLDASGKNTQALRLRDFLIRRGESVYVRIHPSDDNWAGVRARRFLLSEGRSAHFASAIFYIVDIIRSILRCPWWLYEHVVFVRYLMGTAYLPSPLHRILYHFFAAILPRPGQKFYLDVDPEEAHKRILEDRSELEMFESLEQLRKVGAKALYLARMNGWAIIDGNGSRDDVEERIQAYFL